MPKNEQVNFVTGPVEAAMKIHLDQQERILNYIQGPFKPPTPLPPVTDMGLQEFLQEPTIQMLTNR
jgi:hypothetical protein